MGIEIGKLNNVPCIKTFLTDEQGHELYISKIDDVVLVHRLHSSKFTNSELYEDTYKIMSIVLEKLILERQTKTPTTYSYSELCSEYINNKQSIDSGYNNINKAI